MNNRWERLILIGPERALFQLLDPLPVERLPTPSYLG